MDASHPLWSDPCKPRCRAVWQHSYPQELLEHLTERTHARVRRDQVSIPGRSRMVKSPASVGPQLTASCSR